MPRSVRLIGAIMVCLLAVVPAWAHVVVLPVESEAGGWERYVVIVPTEKASPTVRVQVVLPVGMEIVAVESKVGWQGVYKPFPIGAATVQWHAGQAGQAATAGRIPKGEFMSFEFLAWNPPAARTVSWVATQWYEDETSDEWGGKGDATHASTTVLRPSTRGKDQQNHQPRKH